MDENETIKERRKHEINPTQQACPVCGQYPLEQEIMEYERFTFCTRCNYSLTKEQQ